LKNPPRQIRPRRGSLWKVTGDAAAQVEEAKQHLLKLFADPYYYEALQEIRRDAPYPLRGLSGRAQRKRGALSHKLQYGKQRKPVGRPPLKAKQVAHIEAWEQIANEAINCGKAKNTSDAVRKILTMTHPKDSQGQIEEDTKRIRQQIFDHRIRIRRRRDDLKK